MYEDKTLVCKDCGQEFVWTAGEQEFYARAPDVRGYLCSLRQDRSRALPAP